MDNEHLYLANDQSIFLIEEVSNRTDYQLLGKKRISNFRSYTFTSDNRWTNEKKDEIIQLFQKQFSQLTDNEIRIFQVLNTSLSFGSFIFLGPNLRIQLMVNYHRRSKNLTSYFAYKDEGLYHFRMTYLWGDQFCLTSTDLLVCSISCLSLS